MRLPALLVILLFSFPTFASDSSFEIAGMYVNVWEPENTAKAPVVIFSHGFHGCSTQSTFLMKAMAKDGYIVFAPNHKDAACGKGTASRSSRPETGFGRPDQWDETTFRDRHNDIVNLIAALKTDPRFQERIDWSHMALAGHSLGGYTMLALSGALPEWKIPGVKAILAVSPYTLPLRQLKSLSAPVMYQGGTRDIAVTPSVSRKNGAYDQSPSPKYFVSFYRANHFAWTDISRTAHKQITQYSLAFLDHYLKGKDGTPLTQEQEGVSILRYSSELGTH